MQITLQREFSSCPLTSATPKSCSFFSEEDWNTETSTGSAAQGRGLESGWRLCSVPGSSYVVPGGRGAERGGRNHPRPQLFGKQQQQQNYILFFLCSWLWLLSCSHFIHQGLTVFSYRNDPVCTSSSWNVKTLFSLQRATLSESTLVLSQRWSPLSPGPLPTWSWPIPSHLPRHQYHHHCLAAGSLRTYGKLRANF